MPLVLATMRDMVYRECGSPSPQDLPNVVNGAIDEKIRLATRVIARRSAGDPIFGELSGASLDFIQGQAGVFEYAIPTDRDVLHVYWGPGEDIFAAVPTDAFRREFDFERRGLYHGSVYYRSDDLITEMKRRQLIESRYFGEVFAGKIRVQPAPTADNQRIYYTYLPSTITITILDVKWETVVLYLATAYCLRVLGNRFRGKALSFSTDGLGLSEKSSEFDARADDYERRGFEELEEVLSS